MSEETIVYPTKQYKIFCQVKGHELQKLKFICLKKDCSDNYQRILCLKCLNKHSKDCLGHFSNIKQMLGQNRDFEILREFKVDLKQPQKKIIEDIMSENLMNYNEQIDSYEIQFVHNWFNNNQLTLQGQKLRVIYPGLIQKLKNIQNSDYQAKLMIKNQLIGIYDNYFLKEKFALFSNNCMNLQELNQYIDIYIKQTLLNQKQQIEYSLQMKQLICSPKEEFLQSLLEENTLNFTVQKFFKIMDSQLSKKETNYNLPMINSSIVFQNRIYQDDVFLAYYNKISKQQKITIKMSKIDEIQYPDQFIKSVPFSAYEPMIFKFNLQCQEIPNISLGVMSKSPDNQEQGALQSQQQQLPQLQQIQGFVNLKKWVSNQIARYQEVFKQLISKEITLKVKIHIQQNIFEITDPTHKKGYKCKLQFPEELKKKSDWQFFIKFENNSITQNNMIQQAQDLEIYFI